MPHLRALDGLRGVAVLVVVLYHFSPGILPGGFIGVDMFFVLSGFLITSLLVNEWEGTRRISLPAFWSRRARRLLPALFLVLIVVGFYAVFIAHAVEAQHVANDGLAALSYVANWRFIASGQAYIQTYTNQAASPLRHMWSLAIEEQFYLLWPLLVAGIGLVVARGPDRAGRRRRRLRRTLVTVCVVLGAASVLRMVTLYQPGGDPNRVYYGTDTRAFVLLIGAALGAWTAGVPIVTSPRARRLLVGVGCISAGALVAVMATVTTNSPWLYEGGYGLLAVAIVVVLAAAAQPGRNLLARLLEWRPLVGLGLISYGVYLWHWPATVWLTTHSTGLSGFALFTLRAVTTLGVSIASYVLVEQPIRRGRLPTLNVQTPGVVPMAVVTTVAVVLLVPALTLPSIQLAPAVPSSKNTALVAGGATPPAVPDRRHAADHGAARGDPRARPRDGRGRLRHDLARRGLPVVAEAFDGGALVDGVVAAGRTRDRAARGRLGDHLAVHAPSDPDRNGGPGDPGGGRPGAVLPRARGLEDLHAARRGRVEAGCGDEGSRRDRARHARR